ncbi:MAG: hypothetical protein C0524_04415 [Rhodobacter sp.]|nr:hypothetical protein [Rhodobacter sp.]
MEYDGALGAGRKVTMSKRAILATLQVVAIIAAWSCRSWLPVLREELVRDTVEGLDTAGPLALIGLMVLAIAASPIPSSPIALAAGALYGTLCGGALVVTGAVLGGVLGLWRSAVSWL